MNRFLGGFWLAALGCALLVAACAGTSSDVGSMGEPDGGTKPDGSMLPEGSAGDGNGGEACKPGETKLADDGCNTCTCGGGAWACTDKACVTCSPGETMSDGCTDCVCSDFGNGPTWACTANACPPAECKPGSTRSAGDGCNTCQCGMDGAWTCTMKMCASCSVGDTQPAGDGCNTCTCTESGWECTLLGCQLNCEAPFDDCDFDASNGCETNVQTSVTNCGGCGFSCAMAGASSTCVKGKCVLDQCQKGYADCNRDPSDGCEAMVGAGGCAERCDVPADAPPAAPSMDPCSCVPGTVCVRDGVENPAGNYCVPVPSACNGAPSCACMGLCACSDSPKSSCTDEMSTAGPIIAYHGIQ